MRAEGDVRRHRHDRGGERHSEQHLHDPARRGAQRAHGDGDEHRRRRLHAGRHDERRAGRDLDRSERPHPGEQVLARGRPIAWLGPATAPGRAPHRPWRARAPRGPCRRPRRTSRRRWPRARRRSRRRRPRSPPGRRAAHGRPWRHAPARSTNASPIATGSHARRAPAGAASACPAPGWSRSSSSSGPSAAPSVVRRDAQQQVHPEHHEEDRDEVVVIASEPEHEHDRVQADEHDRPHRVAAEKLGAAPHEEDDSEAREHENPLHRPERARDAERHEREGEQREQRAVRD